MPKYNPFIWGTVAPLAQSFGGGVQHEMDAQNRLRNLMAQYQALRPMEIQNEIEKRKALAGYEAGRPLTPEETAQGNVLSQLFKQDYPDLPISPEDMGRLGKGESPILRYLGQRGTTAERAQYHKDYLGMRERLGDVGNMVKSVQADVAEGKLTVAQGQLELNKQIQAMRESQGERKLTQADVDQARRQAKTEADIEHLKVQAPWWQQRPQTDAERAAAATTAAGAAQSRAETYGATQPIIAGAAASRAGTYAAKNIDPATGRPYTTTGRPKDLSLVMGRADKLLHNRLGVDYMTQALRKQPDYPQMMQEATRALMNNQDFDVNTTPPTGGIFGWGQTPGRRTVVPRPIAAPMAPPGAPTTADEWSQRYGQ